MAHPIVNAGFRFRLSEGKDHKVEEATIVYGGLASLNCRAYKTEQFLLGKPINTRNFEVRLVSSQTRSKGMTIPMEEEGISTNIAFNLAENFFYKFFLHVHLSIKPELVNSQIAISRKS